MQDVVLLADKRPVLLRLHLQIDGRPFQAVHKEALDGYLAALFTQLDADGDGFLSEEEARRMPPPFKPPADPGAAAVNVAFNYRVVDADGDGRVTREELADYFRQFGGGAVQFQPAACTAVLPASWTRRCSRCSTRTRTASSPATSWRPRRRSCFRWTKTTTSC